MAGIKRLQAVPVVFVWIALCFPGPSAAMGTVQARDGAFAVVLAAPCAPPAQLVRAKADKPLVFSTACLAPPQAVACVRTYRICPRPRCVDCSTRPSSHRSSSLSQATTSLTILDAMHQP